MAVDERPLARRLSALLEAGMVLASELDLNSLLQRIADLAREVIGADYAAVGVLDDEGRLARFVFSGVDQATADKIGSLPEGKGVLGVIIEEGRPLRLRHITDHPASAGFPEHHPKMDSFLGVPISVRAQVFGRLYLSEKRGRPDFTKDDERIAMTFAAQAGTAVENARLYDEVRLRSEELMRRVAELSSIERVGKFLLGEESIAETIRSIVEEARRHARADRATLALLDKDSGDLIIRHAVGDALAGDLLGTTIPVGSSKAHAVLQRSRAEVVDDMKSDPEVHDETWEKLGRPVAGGFAPLIVRDDGIGTLAVYGSTPFSPDDLAILQILANQAAIALENDRLTQALRDYAVLEERDRISKELHDGVIQSIYSVGLSLQGATGLMERDPSKAQDRIMDAIAELDNVVRDVRSYIFELRPRLVASKGLVSAIEALAKEHEVNTLADTVLELQSDACEAIGEEQTSEIFHIVREVLSNIARHAQARHVWIRCERVREGVLLALEEDGIGFDPATVARGHGLDNLAQRAERMGAEMRIEPRGPKGMRYTLLLADSPGRD